MRLYFARILFRSLVSDKLTFTETRFLRITGVSDFSVQLQLVPNSFDGVYIEPNTDAECQEPVHFPLESLEKTLDRNAEEFFFREDLCDVFIESMTEYQENFHYVYAKDRLSEWSQMSASRERLLKQKNSDFLYRELELPLNDSDEPTDSEAA